MSAIAEKFSKDREASMRRGAPQMAILHRSITKLTWPLLLGLLSFAATAARAQFSSTVSGGAVTITRYSGPGGDVVIPSVISNLPVTTIGFEAFYGVTNVTSVTMPGSVVTIETDAFEYCSLAGVTLSTNLGTIESEAFSMSGLTNVDLPASLTNLGVGVFGGSTNLSAINVDPLNAVYTSTNGVLFNLGRTMLVEYPGLGGSYEIPTNVTVIGTEAFVDTSLTNVTIPTNVTVLGEQAFSGAALTSVSIPASVTNFGDYAFSYCPVLASVTVACANIGQDAFYDCTGLTNVTVQAGVTNIGEDAFNQCSGLTDVSLPAGLLAIGEDAFAQCYSLASIELRPSLTSVGLGAFSDCTSLARITIPSTVTNIGLEVFLGCSALQLITVSSQNSHYSSVNGVLFDKDQTTLIECPGALGGSYAVPATVTSIETYAFFNCLSLTNVVIPPSVTNISDHAFYYCPSLVSIFFGGDYPAIGSFAFLSDNDATAYYMPGDTNWVSPVQNIPAVQWNPFIQANDPSFGISNQMFGFNITGTTNISFVLEICTNLSSHEWVPLQSVRLTKGSLFIDQPLLTNGSGCLFRIRSP